ncbi:hypothetical protein Rrhod_1341 [Rhodococcus rhodnii LMG 5362]|uniref:Uncharacterized protein n=1 Tax=Rhodococcus rhodnii LMG 5362 TaxID=1273125 RepID=R7WT08_9NOCA|nr:hypothetical protein Rrhod_1341 [Rhodococcus rhodnii LMG 5362]
MRAGLDFAVPSQRRRAAELVGGTPPDSRAQASFTRRQLRRAERVEIDGKMVHPQADHGTIHGYKTYECRCTPCSDANSRLVQLQRAASRAALDARAHALRPAAARTPLLLGLRTHPRPAARVRHPLPPGGHTMTMTEPREFRKRPVVIEAMQMPEDADPPASHAVYLWVESNTAGSFEPLAVIEGRKACPASGVSLDPRDGRMIISTLEGLHWVDLGDWVIRGVAGEFYPCKPDIFAATYDAVPA